MTNPRTGPRDGRIAAPACRRRVLVIGADADLAAWIEAGLPVDGYDVRVRSAVDGDGRPDLVIVDLPYPSRACVDSLRARLAPHDRLPILVLSSGVFASVACCGPATRALGVDGLLAKPSTGDALRRAVDQLTGT